MKNKIVYLLLHSISCLVHADLRDTINLLLPTSQNSDVNNKAVFYSVDVHFGIEAGSIKTKTVEILQNALFDNDITIKGNLNLSGAILKNNRVLVAYDSHDNLLLGTKTTNQTLTGHENIAIGHQAGSHVITGSNNILIGNQGAEPESDTIRIGNASHTGGNFQAGIYNMTAADTNTSAVSVDGNGQLGTGLIYNDINLANTDSSSGAILKDGTLWLHDSGFTENTFLGKDAGNRYVNGGQNTAIGAYSGHNLYTAYDNTLIGLRTGENLVVGSQNSAVGVRALRWNVSGSHNTAVGFESGYTINNGHNNTLIGDSAGNVILDGSNNVAIGYQAAYNAETGSDNIVIGYQAGSNVITGSNNILIGNLGAEPESNTIRIGNGSHTDTFLSGNVDIPGHIYAHTFDTLPTLTGGGTYTLMLDSNDNKIKRYAIASSKRFKENIREISKTTLNNFKLLNGVEFSYIQDARKHKQYGFIAEEVNEVMPELIVYDIDGKIFSVNYSVMYALLQTWIKNLQAQTDLQSDLLDIHENTINNLQTQIDEQLTIIADQQMTINSMIARLVAVENYLAKQTDSTFQQSTVVDTTDNSSEQTCDDATQNYNDDIVSIYDTE
ncbi:tail fiber domain-containing protein [bacterium]|nr:MAG: tail fiber domain-containing protein [bacterium]QQR62803.1 MAG: tail fiber domain-containing protein [bacterium]